MNALLVRVGADQSAGGGRWNGIVDSKSREFVYVSIPEEHPIHRGMERPYSGLAPILSQFGIALPAHLAGKHMHLDPDFEHLTYGDQGERAKQIRAHLRDGDLIVFYAGLRDITPSGGRLVYAIIGLLQIECFRHVADVVTEQRDHNAHSRRTDADASDLIVRGITGLSGRLRSCLPIGEYRERAYRVTTELLTEWDHLSVKDGYLQRSARLPRFLNPALFMRWIERQDVELVHANN